MMNKIFFILSLFFAVFLQAQNEKIIYETFDDGKYPPGWVRERKTNWGSNAGNNAGGQAPELVFAYIQQEDFETALEGRSYVEIPIFKNRNYEQLLFSMKYRFLATTEQTNKSYGVLIRTSSAQDWEVLFSVKDAPAMAKGAVLSVQVGEIYKEADSIQFAIFMENHTMDMTQYMFCFDDVLVADIKETEGGLSLPSESWFTGDYSFPIRGQFYNKGIAVNSFEVSYQINKEEVMTTSFEEAVNPFEKIDFRCRPDWQTSPGKHLVKVWLSSINGKDYPQTDTLEKVLFVTGEGFKKRPVFEEFTSSSCGPCASLNASVIKPFVTNYGERFTLLKYQVNIPGNDPYTLPVGEKRLDMYAVPGVPYMLVDGEAVKISGDNLLSALRESEAEDAYFSIAIDSFAFDSLSWINFDVEITSLVDASDIEVHVLIVEQKTTGNKGSNGEKEFYDVVMAMPYGAFGKKDTFSMGNSRRYIGKIQKRGTNIEEIFDLKLSVFLQDVHTKKIWQSAEKEIKAKHISIEKTALFRENLAVYPNPCLSELSFTPFSDEVRLKIMDASGREVCNQSLPAGKTSFSVSSLSPGLHHIQWIQKNGRIQYSRFMKLK